MRTPLSRRADSPAARFLRDLLHPAAADPLAAWAGRLRAGGIVREAAAATDLRRCLPLLASRLAAAGLRDEVPPDERATLLAARLSGADRARAVAATLGPLGAACAAAGVAPLLLKGTALHGTLYPDPASRPVSDADAYVPPEAFPAFRVALSAAGLVPDRVTAGRLAAYDATGGREARLSDFVYRRGDGQGVPVEAKLDPVQAGLPLRRGPLFADGATPSAKYAGFLVPAAEPMAVQQALHLARHDGADLLWFAEIAQVLDRARRAGGFRAGAALALVEGEGLLGSLRGVMTAVEDVFPGSVPAALRRGPGRAGATPSRFRARRGGGAEPDERLATWSLQAAHALGAGRPGSVIEALWRRANPRGEYVAARMGLPPGSKAGLGARVRRLAALLRPGRRA